MTSTSTCFVLAQRDWGELYFSCAGPVAAERTSLRPDTLGIHPIPPPLLPVMSQLVWDMWLEGGKFRTLWGPLKENPEMGRVRGGLWNPNIAVEGEPQTLGLGTESRRAFCAVGLGGPGAGQALSEWGGWVRWRRLMGPAAPFFTEGQTLISGNWQNGCSKTSRHVTYPP